MYKILKYQEVHVFGLKNRIMVITVNSEEWGRLYNGGKKLYHCFAKEYYPSSVFILFVSYWIKETCSVHIHWTLVWTTLRVYFLQTKNPGTSNESTQVNPSEL